MTRHSHVLLNVAPSHATVSHVVLSPAAVLVIAALVLAWSFLCTEVAQTIRARRASR